MDSNNLESTHLVTYKSNNVAYNGSGVQLKKSLRRCLFFFFFYSENKNLQNQKGQYNTQYSR